MLRSDVLTSAIGFRLSVVESQRDGHRGDCDGAMLADLPA